MSTDIQTNRHNSLYQGLPSYIVDLECELSDTETVSGCLNQNNYFRKYKEMLKDYNLNGDNISLVHELIDCYNKSPYLCEKISILRVMKDLFKSHSPRLAKS